MRKSNIYYCIIYFICIIYICVCMYVYLYIYIYITRSFMTCHDEEFNSFYILYQFSTCPLIFSLNNGFIYFPTLCILTFTMIRSLWDRHTNLKFWVKNWIFWTQLNFDALKSAAFNILAQVTVRIISWWVFSTYCTNIPIGDI